MSVSAEPRRGRSPLGRPSALAACRIERQRREGGSASVLAVGLIAVVLTVMAGGLLLARAVQASARAAAAADQAAVAGARVLQGGTEPAACAAAARVAGLNGAAITTCSAEADTLVVRLSVPSGVSGFGPAYAVARAGPKGTDR